MKKKELNRFFITPDNVDFCNKLFSDSCRISLEFKNSINMKNHVIDYKNQEKIANSILEDIPEDYTDIEEVIKEFKENVLNGSVNFSSKNFMAFPDSANSIGGNLGAIFSQMLNQNMINSIHTSPTATFVEISVINWLRSLVRYKTIQKPDTIFDVGGINVPGGVLANVVALLLALWNRYPEYKETGIIDKNIKILVPEDISHYSSIAAMSWLGLGRENVIYVKVTSDFIIDKEDLKNKINQYKKDNKLLFLVAYAGDSRTMSVDNFEELHKILEPENIWLHVDGCHGTSLCFSDKLKYRLNGIEKADSITLDPHKVLFTPYSLSYVLFKNPENLKVAGNVSDLITLENLSLGQITPFLGSRPFNSLKLWFVIKNLGRKKIGELIEQRHEMAKKFIELISKKNNFYVFNKNVNINSVCFIYIPDFLKENISKSNEKINLLNKRIQNRLFKEGLYYVHTFALPDFANVISNDTKIKWQVMRLMIGNPLTDTKTLEEFIKYLNEISIDEAKKMLYDKDEKSLY